MISNLFNDPGLRKVWLKVRYLLAPVFLFILLKYMKQEYLIAGFLVSLFGELIQTWSFASLVKNVELTVRGPYVLVRNPMYLGRYFLVLGFIMLFGQPWLIALYTIIYILYMVNRVKREEQRLVETLEGYDAYRKKVRAFIPGKGVSNEAPLWYFSWDTLRNNHGDKNFLVFIIIYAIIFSYSLFTR